MIPPRRPRREVKKPPPYFRFDWDVPDAAALQALQRGTADADQQKRALDWIIRNGAATYQETFQPDGERHSSFMQGRRAVGLKIVELLSVSTRDLLQKEQPT